MLLPKTTFPQKIQGEKRVKLDNAIVNSTSFQSEYARQMSEKEKPLWILHDGPPYANGPVHMGHAVNKILKDITNRWKVSSGYRCHYVPGWDCHGLPIELKALSKARSRNKDPLSVRALSRNFAIQAVEEQKSQFVSWGVMADWTKPYLTMDSHFVKAQLKLFYKLYNNGCIYQRFMPVYWSPSSQSALAESELEYNSNHVSTAIYIRFPVVTATIPSEWPSSSDLYFLSWTTTPWSIAANRAIAFSADADYVIVQDPKGKKNYIVAFDLLSKNDELVDIFGSNPKIMQRFKAETMANLRYTHPLKSNTEMKIYAGSHVTLTAGTGLVHTAPAHGQEDYLLGLEHDLDLSCPVNEVGKYDSSVIHPKLEGLDVLGRGNDVILQLLHENNHILKQSKFMHSYPYDWRTKKPVILRGSRQWFMDTKSLQIKALEAIKNNIEVNPMSKSGFETILRARPYWCISRQRVWGVPIPVFYNQDEQVVVNENVIDKLCDLVDEHDNIDFWWKWDDSTLGEKLKIPEHQNVIKGKDILDVWFDSGVTWNAVLPSLGSNEDGNAIQKADLYLEGLDQFSGWFYSSLLTSLGSQEQAAYKKIFVHGFTLDENGRKMSKSLGNVIAPSSITSGKNSYGVDVLRYWVAAHASSSTSVPVSDKILKMSSEDVDRTRNVLRYIISNLNDDELVLLQLKELKMVDQYVLHLLSDFCQTLAHYYDAMAYNKVCQSVQHFIANDLSAFFFTIIKDRLYCEPRDSLARKSALTTLFWIGKYLSVYLKPILPILSYEVMQHCNILNESSSLKTNFKNDLLKDRFQDIIAIRRCLNQNKVKKSDCVNLGSSVGLGLSLEDLAEIWQVAFVTQDDNLKTTTFNINGILVDVKPSGMEACPRCRLFCSPTEEDLCKRCRQVVNSITV